MITSCSSRKSLHKQNPKFQRQTRLAPFLSPAPNESASAQNSIPATVDAHLCYRALQTFFENSGRDYLRRGASRYDPRCYRKSQLIESNEASELQQ